MMQRMSERASATPAAPSFRLQPQLLRATARYPTMGAGMTYPYPDAHVAFAEVLDAHFHDADGAVLTNGPARISTQRETRQRA